MVQKAVLRPAPPLKSGVPRRQAGTVLQKNIILLDLKDFMDIIEIDFYRAHSCVKQSTAKDFKGFSCIYIAILGFLSIYGFNIIFS
jgi:hypothetical protein